MHTPAAEQTPQEGVSDGVGANPREAAIATCSSTSRGRTLRPWPAERPPRAAPGEGMGHEPPPTAAPSPTQTPQRLHC